MTDLTPPVPPAEPARQRSPLWMRVVLAVSLALNLAVVGLVIGSAARDRWDDRHAAGGRPHGEGGSRGDAAAVMMPYAAALTQDERRALGREVLGRIRAEGIGLRDLRASVQAVAAAVRAVPFRPEDVAAELDRQRAALGRVQELSHAAILARLEAMTPEERAAFADRLEDGLRRRGGPRN
jgi:uncharacterized membrane protein